MGLSNQELQNLLATTNLIHSSLVGASENAAALHSAVVQAINAVKSGQTQREARADYFAEKEIDMLLTRVTSAISFLGNLTSHIESLESSEGVVEKGIHRRFVGVIEGQLRKLQTAIARFETIEGKPIR